MPREGLVPNTIVYPDSAMMATPAGGARICGGLRDRTVDPCPSKRCTWTLRSGAGSPSVAKDRGIGNLFSSAPPAPGRIHLARGVHPLTTSRSRMLVRIAAHVLAHPRLAWLLLGAAWRFRARDWYRRPPYLPLPPAGYLEWRLHTAYGDEAAVPTLKELRRYLEWAASMRRVGRSTGWTRK